MLGRQRIAVALCALGLSGCDRRSAELTIGGIETVEFVVTPAACRPAQCEAPDFAARTLTDLAVGRHEFTLNSDTIAYRLADGCTVIEPAIPHAIIRGGDWMPGFGLPRVNVPGGWATIHSKITVHTDGYVHRIEHDGCLPGDPDGIPYEHCTLRVETTCADAEPVEVTPLTTGMRFNTRDAARKTHRQGAQFLDFAEWGFDIGNINRQVDPPEPRMLRVGLDVVTAFGVANLDLDYFNEQVIGAAFEVDIGPHALDVEILDAGNVNTHCWTGSCINVLDFDVVDAPSDGTHIPAILEYR